MKPIIPDAALTQHLVVLGRAPAVIVATETDKAYAAGFFDGEGNVCIARNFHAGKDGTRDSMNMRIGASQCDPGPLLWLRDRWGGSVQKISRNRCHEWRCFSLGAAAFLGDVLPYLQIKRERAELALEFQRTSFQPGRRAHTPERKERRIAMKAEMNRLNLHPAPAA